VVPHLARGRRGHEDQVCQDGAVLVATARPVNSYHWQQL